MFWMGWEGDAVNKDQLQKLDRFKPMLELDRCLF